MEKSNSQASRKSAAQKIIDDLDAKAALARKGSEYSAMSSELGGKANLDAQESDDADSDEVDQSDVVIKNSDLIFQPESQTRDWLLKHGKAHCIEFQQEELNKLRTYFNSLDDDGSGSIGVDELEDPLIALGLVDNR